MNSRQVDAYLHRIGASRPPRPTGAALRELHLCHLRTVPFENLSVHLGEEIELAEDRLLEKITERRRGGFCYELNGAFGALLTALGYEVDLLAARVYDEEGRLGIPYDHLALRVRTADGEDWLADVGFGAHSHYPLAYRERGEQTDRGGVFQVVAAGADAAGTRGDGESGEGGDLDVVRDGRAQYRLETRPRAHADFAAGAWWHTTSPLSHFTRSLVCSRVTEDGGRITLGGRTLTTTAADGTRTTREWETDAEVLAVYRELFGIELDSVPTVRNRNRTS
ncbi:arylamine N-acetyltransferase family protein [Streptomyces sp. NPDC001606]